MADCRNLLIRSNSPLISRGLINHWEQINWNQEKWASAFPEETYPFRSALNKCSEVPIHETECDILFMSMEEFFRNAENPEIMSRKWYYYDYKTLSEYDQFKHIFAQNFSWRDVGFPEKNARDSYIWVGSIGAHTLCHYDTYGFNIVAQLYGRKRWLLFPPTETKTLCPTRVPFEESTVGSKLNFTCKRGVRRKQLCNCFVVDLDPGDILYIPSKWWHFVTNLTTAISVNVWIPTDADDESRLEEALVSSYIYSVTQLLPVEQKNKLINPNQVFEDDYTSIIKYCVSKTKTYRNQSDTAKKQPVIEDTCKSNDQFDLFKSPQRFPGDVEDLISCRCNGEETVCEVLKNSHDLKILENIIDSFCQPNIVSQIKEELLKNVDKTED